MKIILLTNHAAILPAISHFHAQNWLKAVISPEEATSQSPQIPHVCRELNIPFYAITYKDLTTTISALFDEIKPTLAFICGFSYKLPYPLFSAPSLGCFNIHFSLLPAYAGPDPIFWQIRNGEDMGGITIHHVNENFDSGEIVMQQQIQFIPGENWGICNTRYASVVLNMLIELIANLQNNHRFTLKLSSSLKASYFPMPAIKNLYINWDEDTTEEIENLVNACNPTAGGAISYLNYQLVRILEVSPVDGKSEGNVAAGTIIHADPGGIYVQCIENKLLRINILKLNEGYITGAKLAALGVKKGDIFQSELSTHPIMNN